MPEAECAAECDVLAICVGHSLGGHSGALSTVLHGIILTMARIGPPGRTLVLRGGAVWTCKLALKLKCLGLSTCVGNEDDEGRDQVECGCLPGYAT